MGAPRGGEGEAGAETEGDGPYPPGIDLGRFTKPDPVTMAARQWAFAANVDGEICRTSLAHSGATFTNVKDVPTPDKNGCGIPHGVLVSKGPTGIVWEPPLLIDCSFALALPRIERVIQEESERALGVTMARVQTFGTYACRTREGRAGAAMSDHAFGLAVDIAAFVPTAPRKNQKPITVLRDWDKSVFLQDLLTRLRTDGGLSVVLGPDYDASHRNHFHLDRGWRWWHPTGD